MKEIEMGILVAGPLDEVDRDALRMAVATTKRELDERFSEFTFRFRTIRRPELTDGGRVEPSPLLQQATEDRDARHWDFVFVITAAELVGFYSPYCFAAISRPLDAAVISMSLIDPQAEGIGSQDDARVERLSSRVSRLIHHSLAHLLGLAQDNRPDHLLFHPAMAEDLDQMTEFDVDQIDRQREAMREIADLRLEEGHGERMSYPGFAVRAAWINRREIWQAIWAARPWQFPRRLSRLTIAAVSTVAILLMTAEAWDLALSQPWLRVFVLACTTLIATTLYVIVRQQLLIRRSRIRSEQTVVTAASAFAIVFTGMTVTWLTLFLSSIFVSSALFDRPLVASWAASSELVPRAIDWLDYVKMAAFGGSVGLLIGALGASFESQNYFRHVIFVDEEI